MTDTLKLRTSVTITETSGAGRNSALGADDVAQGPILGRPRVLSDGGRREQDDEDTPARAVSDTTLRHRFPRLESSERAEAAADGVPDETRSSANLQLLHDATPMGLGCLDAHAQERRDLPRPFSLGNELQHLPLS
jgi:hypothetical protein